MPPVAPVTRARWSDGVIVNVDMVGEEDGGEMDCGVWVRRDRTMDVTIP